LPIELTPSVLAEIIGGMGYGCPPSALLRQLGRVE
jgi:hypothetical protein